MTDQSIMPYGQYKGEKLINIPDSYFIFLYGAGKCFGELKVYIEKNFPVQKPTPKNIDVKQQMLNSKIPRK